MDKKKIAWIKSGLRRLFGRSWQRKEVLKLAKVSYNKYRCGGCGKLFGRREVQVDHKVAVGRFVDWDGFIERLFVETNGLELLCVACHKLKTKKDLKKMKKSK